MLELITTAFFFVLYSTDNVLLNLNVGVKQRFVVATLFSASFKRTVHAS